jgi:hypothetical protein
MTTPGAAVHRVPQSYLYVHMAGAPSWARKTS